MLQKDGFNFNGVNILPTADDRVFFSVDNVNKTFLVHAAEVSGVQPTVSYRLGSQFRVLVVFLHDAVSLHNDLTHLSLGYILILFINDPQVPRPTRFPYRGNFPLVSDPKSDHTRAGTFG